MNSHQRFASLLIIVFMSACTGPNADSPTSATSIGSDGTASQLAAGSLGGSSNDNPNGGSGSYSLFRFPHSSVFDKIIEELNPLPFAFAYNISCSGGAMSPSTYANNTTFQWTPISCSLTYNNGSSSGTTWSTYFDLNYDSTCTAAGSGGAFQLSSQGSGCIVTRTTPSGGNVRTITRPDGNVHAVTIDTTSEPSGYDSTVTTTTAGTVLTATSANFGTWQIVMNGTHLVSTLNGSTNWNHTVSTDPVNPIVVTGTGSGKVVSSGTIIIQHNLAQMTSKTVVSSALAYTNPNCCYPTSGTLTTTFSNGIWSGKTESISFSSSCGEATLTNTTGVSSPVTLVDCL